MKNGYVERGWPMDIFASNRRMRDELLKKTLFLSIDHARVKVVDYNWEEPHSSLGYETSAAFADKLDKRRSSAKTWPSPDSRWGMLGVT